MSMALIWSLSMKEQNGELKKSSRGKLSKLNWRSGKPM